MISCVLQDIRKCRQGNYEIMPKRWTWKANLQVKCIVKQENLRLIVPPRTTSGGALRKKQMGMKTRKGDAHGLGLIRSRDSDRPLAGLAARQMTTTIFLFEGQLCPWSSNTAVISSKID